MRNLHRLCSPGFNEMRSLVQITHSVPVNIRKLSRLALLGTLLTLASCASTGPDDISNTPEKISDADDKSQPILVPVDDELRNDMVRNLVSVVPQLLEPLSNTIQFNEIESGNVSPAINQLVELGYGMQRVDADQGKYFLNLDDVTAPEDVERNETRLRISIGDVELTRSYRKVNTSEYVEQNTSTNSKVQLVWRGDQTIIPAGPMLLAGSRLPVKVGGFELAPTSTVDGDLNLLPSSVQYTTPAPIEGGIPSIALITDDLIQQVAQEPFPSIGLPDLTVDTFTLENMTHVFDEAFASLEDNYTRIRQETVIFPNDSQYLGRPGKLIVKKIIGRYSENTDLVGIVGCSNGFTKLEIGNEGLALGRAKRIAEEFYTAGIARDKVFNEGCWSPTAGIDGFPSRGVVIDLWRRKT